MEFNLVASVLASLICGIAIGIYITSFHTKTLGTFLIDISDREEKRFFVTLDGGNLQKVPRHGFVRLKVKEVDLSKDYHKNKSYNEAI